MPSAALLVGCRGLSEIRSGMFVFAKLSDLTQDEFVRAEQGTPRDKDGPIREPPPPPEPPQDARTLPITMTSGERRRPWAEVVDACHMEEYADWPIGFPLYDLALAIPSQAPYASRPPPHVQVDPEAPV